MDEQIKQHSSAAHTEERAPVTQPAKLTFVEPEVSAPVNVLAATEFFGGGSFPTEEA